MQLIKKYWWVLILIVLLFSKKKIDQVANVDDELKQGDKNYDVLTLQKWINSHLSSGKIKEDSIYGPNTAFALFIILESEDKLDEDYITLIGDKVNSVDTKWLYSTIK
jgi:hypothetical protein